MMEKVKITLKISLIQSKTKKRATAASMGFRKIGDSIVLDDDAATAGKVNVISHLVKVEKQ
ncbi:MAG: 50S ribosomal protein L30 [Firmicutes bacterium]|nr:50S ribosomal protein L30 [Bacillota bacterium]